jgi:hypothetical protein
MAQVDATKKKDLQCVQLIRLRLTLRDIGQQNACQLLDH